MHQDSTYLYLDSSFLIRFYITQLQDEEDFLTITIEGSILT